MKRKRYHQNYRTASDVKRNYQNDLTSEAAKKVNAELQELGLPRLAQFEGEFLELCSNLKVE